MRDPDLDFLKSVRLLAIGAVRDQDGDYLLRHIFRWYSEKFHTPLHEVEDLPTEDVLAHYYEVMYEEMERSDEGLDEEIGLLAENRDERLLREAAEHQGKIADDDFFRQVQEEARIVREAGGKIGTTPTPVTTRVGLPTMGETVPKLFAEMVGPPDSLVPQIPENVKMTFVSDEDLDADDEWDPVK